MMSFKDLGVVAPLWMNLSQAIFNDVDASREWGWVQVALAPPGPFNFEHLLTASVSRLIENCCSTLWKQPAPSLSNRSLRKKTEQAHWSYPVLQ